MWLDEWIFKNRLKKKTFAEFLGITPSHLNYLINGKRRARYKLAKKIVSLTSNEVTLEEIFCVDPESRKRLTEKL